MRAGSPRNLRKNLKGAAANNVRTTSTGSKSPSTTAAWWPMPGCSFRPPWPGISACPNSSSSAHLQKLKDEGRVAESAANYTLSHG